MVVYLLDTNVLFAAVYQAHASHTRANQWLKGEKKYATCGLTQISTFRLLLADAPMHGSPLEPKEAHKVLSNFTSAKQHVFLEKCPAIAEEFVGQTAGHRAAFDDYLVQIAHASGCKLVTLDQGLTRRWTKHTVLIE